MTADTFVRRVLKPIAFAAALLPFAWLVWKASQGALGVNPQEYCNRYLGDWALRFLLIALAVTPLRDITGQLQLVRFRRMLGLFAFFYVVLHIGSYVVLDQFFDWAAIWKDILKRNYITVGMVGVVILTALAVTSTKGMVKRMGGRNWQRLHRLVYVAGVAGVVHFYMMVKADIREPVFYGAILAFLLGWRAYRTWEKKRARMKAA